MSDANKEDAAAAKAKRDRSPAFPFIPLKIAIARLVAFEQMFGRHPTPAKLSGKAWGYKGWTSQSQQTLAALKSFGLIEYKGSGEALEASITDEGRTYLRAQQDSIKKEALKRCALKPKNVALFYNLWGSDRPPDPVCLDHLVLKSGFTEAAAKSFLRVYDETIDYAGLADSDTLHASEIYDEDENVIEAELVVQEPTAGPQGRGAKATAWNYNVGIPDNAREVKFPLTEGDARFIVPESLSKHSVEDLSDFLEVFLKKLRREAGISAKRTEDGSA